MNPSEGNAAQPGVAVCISKFSVTEMFSIRKIHIEENLTLLVNSKFMFYLLSINEYIERKTCLSKVSTNNCKSSPEFIKHFHMHYFN